MILRRVLSVMLFALTLGGCAVLHHAQVGEIDNRNGALEKARKFDVKVSETGVNLKETANLARAIRGKKEDRAVDDVERILGYFQQGPTTGEKVFNDTYAEKVLALVKAECPDGQITGLMSVRETRKYPVISGEIVKITGYCVTR
jgi:hypothetical protein